MGVKVRLSIPPLRLLSAFMWRVAEHCQVEYYTRLEEYVSVVLEIMPDLLSAEEKVELLLGLRAKFILDLCYSQSSVTLQMMQPHLESVSRIVECAPIDKIGAQTIKTAVKNFVDLILTLLHSPKYRKRFFQEIYPLHYGPKYDKALQLLVLQFLCKLEMLMPVPSFRQVACWFDEDLSLLEDSLQMMYDTKEIENLLQHIKHLPHVDAGFLYSPSLANTILSTLSVSFTVKTVLSPFQNDGSCLSTPHDSRGSVNEGDGHGDVIEEDRCRDLVKEDEDGHWDEEDEHGGMGEHNQCYTRGTDQGNCNERRSPQSISSDQEVLISFDRDPGLSPLQDSMHEHGSQPVDAADDTEVVEGFFSKKRRYKHQTVHKEASGKADERPHGCSYCGKAFRQKSHLTDHIRTHTGERPFSCTVCGRRFAQSTNLRQHRRVHTGERRAYNRRKREIPVSSEEEGTGASPPPKGNGQGDVDELNPQRGNKGSKKRNMDKMCLKRKKQQKVKKRTSEVNGHTRKNAESARTQQEIPTSSGEGPEGSQPQGSLLEDGSRPLNTTDDSTGQIVQHGCAELGDAFSKPALNKDQVIRPYTCSVCGKSFRCTSHLKDHIRVHTGERPFACTVCGARFSQRSNLGQHKRHKHDMDTELRKTLPKPRQKRTDTGSCQATIPKVKKMERPHLCTSCGKSFRHQGDLARHMRVHTGERPYSCMVCQKRFSCRSNLVTHERLHTGERPYLCSFCGKSYPSSGDLLVHTRYHTGERPYKCEFCGKGFIQSCYLTVHRRVHTKEKPYDCSVCKKKFSSSDHMKRHMRTHTGEKPHECFQCGKKFSRKCHLRDHQRVHK